MARRIFWKFPHLNCAHHRVHIFKTAYFYPSNLVQVHSIEIGLIEIDVKHVAK